MNGGCQSLARRRGEEEEGAGVGGGEGDGEEGRGKRREEGENPHLARAPVLWAGGRTQAELPDTFPQGPG